MLEAADADAAGGTEGDAASAGDGDQGPADSSEPSDSEDDASSSEGEMGEDFDVEAMARQILEQAALAGDEGAQREVRRLAGAGEGAATAAPAQPKERAEPRASGLTRQKKRRKRSRITVVET